MKSFPTGVWRKSGRKEFPFLAVGAALCFLLWAFTWIAGEVGESEHLRFEERVMLSMRQEHHPELIRGPAWAGEAARAITSLGGSTAIILITILTLSHLLLNRRVGDAVSVVVAVGGGVILSGLLKHAFDRARPEVAPRLMIETSPSFPSGHSMTSAVVYLTIAALLARGIPRLSGKVFLLGAAALVCGLIGVSRVALGVHYPTDVLAGWAAGSAWALICWSFAHWRHADSRKAGDPH